MNVPLVIWIALIAGILLMLAVDLLKHRDAHEIGLREAGTWTAIWVAVGVGVGAAIWWHYGAEFGLQYFGGYLVEKSLAVDNVFVWALLLAHFAVPARYQHRVLFYGVIGALVFRAVFIAAGSVLIASASWVLYLFGVFLILTGVKMITTREQHVDPERSWSLRIARRLIPVSDEYHGQRFWVRQGGVLMATPLLLVLVVIEFTDILFAVDSIPAIFAITQEPFLVFASNAMAILGMRALYFLLAGVMHRFVYLKAGLAVILVWVGVKMIVGHAWLPIPTAVGLAVIVAILAAAVIASLVSTRRSERPSELAR